MAAEQVHVRQLRANLKSFLSQEDPLVVRKGRAIVAVLMPVTHSWYAERKEIEATCRRLKKSLVADVFPVLLRNGW